LEINKMKVHLNKPGSKNEIHRVKIDDFDTWNMDVTLAYIIVPLLKRLKEVKQGAPFVENEDVPESLRATEEELRIRIEEPHQDADKHYFERWDYIMDEMIFAFESKLDDWEDDFASGENDVDFREIPDKKDSEGEPLFEMVYGPHHTRKYDVVGREKYQDRISNGFRLFGRYYNGLWD